jgi:hypothetical protein
MIHRTTFQQAFSMDSNVLSSPAETIYGRRPIPLAFALVAAGIRWMTGYGLSDTDKVRLKKEYCERAKTLLWNGFFATDVPKNRKISGIEACQTSMILIQVLITLGLAAKAFPLHRAGVDLVRQIALVPHPDGKGLRISQTELPANSSEWITR